MPADIDLQILNGLNMGRILQSNVSCTNITSHIATSMRSKIIVNIIENKRKISILIDESATLSRKEILVICLRFSMDYDGTCQNNILRSYRIRKWNYLANHNVFINRLNMYGLTTEFLKGNLICFSCDGASTMIGEKSCVTTELSKLFPSIIVWH